jgi:TPR repeat protein
MVKILQTGERVLFLVACLFANLCFAETHTPTEMQQLKTEADRGNAQSAVLFGARCLNVYWRAQNYSFNCTARDGFLVVKKAADQGNSEAQNLVADSYFWGNGTTKNILESFKFSKMSAKQGNSQAQKRLGDFYSGQELAIDRSVIHAYAWYAISHSTSNSSDLNPRDLSRLEEIMSKADLISAQGLAKRCQDSNYKYCD